MWRDLQNGAVTEWPDRYNAAFVDGVRYVAQEIDACQAKIMEG